MKRIWILTLLIAACVFLAAQENIDIRKANDIGFDTEPTALADGGSAIVYVDTALGNYDVYAHRFQSTGALLWTAPALVAHKPVHKQNPSLTLCTDGNYLVCWRELNFEGYSLWAQKLDPNGNTLWAEGGIQVFDTQLGPVNYSVVPDSSGGAFIVADTDIEPARTSLWGARLNAGGANLWQANGLALASEASRIYFRKAISDGENGLLTWSVKWVGSTLSGNLRRFSDSGGQIGGDTLFDDPGLNPSFTNIQKSISGGFIVWGMMINPEIKIRFHRIDNLGNPLQAPSVGYPYYGGNIGLYETADGTIYAGWKEYTTGDDTYFKLQRFTPQFAAVWPQPAALSTGINSQNTVRLSVDGNGNIWHSWSSINPQTNTRNIRIQMFDTSGTAAFGESGLLLGNWGTSLLPALQALNPGAMVFWTDYNNDRVSLRRQIVETNGSLAVPAGDECLSSHFRGDLSTKEGHAHADGFTHIWEDFRNPHFRHIYFQKTDLDQNTLYEPQGRRLTSSDASEYYLDSKQNSDGQIMIAYTNSYQEPYNLQVQIIGADGVPLFPGAGLLLRDEARNVNVSSEGSDFYVTWVQTPASGGAQIWGQRFLNGEAMWAAGGIVLYTMPSTYQTALVEVEGRYLLWYYSSILRVSKFEADGSLTPGWNEGGVMVSGSNMSLKKTGMMNGNLVMIFTGTTHRAACLSPTGTMLWSRSLMTGTRYYVDADIYNEVSVLLYNYSGEDYTLYLQRVDQNGELMCEDSGLEVAQGYYGISKSKVINHGIRQISFFSPVDRYVLDDSYLYNLYHYTVDADNQILPGIYLGTVESEINMIPRRTPQKIMLAWEQVDYVNLEWSLPFTSLVGRQFDLQSTALEDETLVPGALISNVSNHPNPFQAKTSISFTLAFPSHLKLDVYNLRGQKVFSTGTQSLGKGEHSLEWNGLDQNGKKLPNGVYLYRLKSEGASRTGKTTLLRY